MGIKTQENDQLFLNLVKSGMFSVSNDGKVFNNKTQRFIGSVHGKYYKFCYKDKRILTHRLVHLLYNGPIPLNYEVNHIDGNKLNNHYTNLEAVTSSENHLHAFRTGLNPKKIGEKNPQSKISDQDALDIRKKYATGNYSFRKLAKEYNLNRITISHIVNGKTYSHIPFDKDIRQKNIGKTNTKQTPELIEKVLNLSKQELSCYKIAKLIPEISRYTIWRIIKKYK